MKHLFIQPHDVLLFRDGRPFSAGADHLAQGLFPPPSPTLYGAFRSALISSQEGANFREDDFGLSGQPAQEAGKKTALGDLQLCSLALAQQHDGALERFYPAPADLLQRKQTGDQSKDYKLLRPRTFGVNPVTNAPLPLLWPQHAGRDFYEASGGWLKEEAFKDYLAGGLPEPGNLLRSDCLFQTEPRTSVEIGKSKTTEEGHLFTVEFTRLKEHVGLAVGFENAESLPERGLLRLGGESRGAAYAPCAPPALHPAPLLQKVAKTGRARLVLLTPVPFKDGWRPDGIGPDGRGSIGGCAVQIMGAAVPRFVPLGGWDLAHGRPKPVRRAVPAGSVYFLELDDRADAERLFEACFNRSIATDEVDRKQGLGLAVLGTY